MDVLVVVSLVSSIASVILAIVAITFAKTAERETRNNFDNTRSTLDQQYEKTKDVLAEIDKRATVIEKTVTDAQDKLLGTVTRIVDETVIPKKQDMGEQFGIMFMQMMMQDPSSAAKMIEGIESLAKAVQKKKG